MPRCVTCGEECEDYKALALHITIKKHRKGKLWAAKYMLQQRRLDRKATLADRAGYVPPTQEDRLNKLSTYRQLSGYNKEVYTICPKCKRRSIDRLPVEFIESPDAWKKEDSFVKMCFSCGGS